MISKGKTRIWDTLFGSLALYHISAVLSSTPRGYTHLNCLPLAAEAPAKISRASRKRSAM